MERVEVRPHRRGWMIHMLGVISTVYVSFVASIYLGLLWSLHFFWYPGWKSISLDTVQTQFTDPVLIAVQFFKILIPLMIIFSMVTVIIEWRSRLRLIALGIFLTVLVNTAISFFLILPVNSAIASGLSSQAALDDLLLEWMRLNDWRMLLSTVIWLLCVVHLLRSR